MENNEFYQLKLHQSKGNTQFRLHSAGTLTLNATQAVAQSTTGNYTQNVTGQHTITADNTLLLNSKTLVFSVGDNQFTLDGQGVTLNNASSL